MICVKYFASLRDRIGRAEDQVPAELASTVGEVWAYVTRGEPLPANLLLAVNMDYATAEQVVHDGDEVAFLPPVTGGGT
jgi:molybdopterin synthase sulfur carrier subunit